jgi:hypothetical protein
VKADFCEWAKKKQKVQRESSKYRIRVSLVLVKYKVQNNLCSCIRADDVGVGSSVLCELKIQ